MSASGGGLARLTGQSRRRLAAGEAERGGGARDRRSGDHSGGGDHPREAQARAHLVAPSVSPETVYIAGGDHLGGDRSSG